MAYEKPLRPDEDEYRTPQVTPDVAPSGNALEPESASPGAGSQPWVILGLVLLAVFAGILAFAVILPALG